ncbi:MAG: lysine 2,3-aminomutase, partial [Gemmatimonadota bacterium]
MADGPSLHRYQAITRQNLPSTPYWDRVPLEIRNTVDLVARVLPFRVSSYVLDELIDWSRIPEDPIFQLTFPQEDFLAEADRRTLRALLDRGARRDELGWAVREIQLGLNPQPAEQLSKNVPTLEGRPLTGLQHKYRETVLFFPAAGQTCHSYCTYCFRWAQFTALEDLRFQARDARDLVAYLRLHPEVTDVLFTGGDPLIMSTRVLRSYLRDLLEVDLPHVHTLRLGTKAFAYWPGRFLTDPDAEDLLRTFEEIVARGWHLAIMAHFSHPVELQPEVA